MDELLKQYTTFTVSKLGFFKCYHMPFGLCNAPAMFQRLMQNCLRELNLTYCLIYLDDIIIFSQAVEEHLHCLCIVFDQFREHNLKLNTSKCELFPEWNYLPSSLSLEGWGLPQWLKPESNCRMCPATNIHQGAPFSQSGGPLQEVHQEGSHALHQALCEYLTGEGASRKSELGVTHQGCHEGLWGIETCMHDSTHPGVCWLHQTIPVGDWYIQRWIRGVVVAEASRLSSTTP